MLQQKLFAVIAGVGPGTGAAIAKKFAQAYSVILLARNSQNLEPIAKDITDQGGNAICIETDLSSQESIANAFRVADKEVGDDGRYTAAIFNASARPVWKSFLELTPEEFITPFQVNCQGGFLFTQAVLPRLLKSAKKDAQYPPTLIFTGATASLKGSAMLSPFAAGKSATRAMVQSVAREFGPKGIHVAHAIIDGLIDIPQSAEMLAGKGPDEKISPETIADTYWYLHTQPPGGFTHELEIRPAAEKCLPVVAKDFDTTREMLGVEQVKSVTYEVKRIFMDKV